MRLPFAQVDAFADRPFTGNPAAIVELEGWLDDATLLAIAAENNLAETAFLLPERDGAVPLRWFTPGVEVEMCGHATLASGHHLLGREPERDSVSFSTARAGELTVSRDTSGYALSLPVWTPEPMPLPDIVAALGLSAGQVEAILWHRAEYAVVALADEAAVRAVEPDFRAIAAMGPVAVIVTALRQAQDRHPQQAQGERVDVVSRVFVPGAGIDEDPVTGSAHAVLTPYWCDRLGRTRFTAHQASARGGTLGCELKGDRAVLTGGAVTVIEGVMTV